MGVLSWIMGSNQRMAFGNRLRKNPLLFVVRSDSLTADQLADLIAVQRPRSGFPLGERSEALVFTSLPTE